MTSDSALLRVVTAGREWTLERPGDLESLWAAMDGSDPHAEDHIPYWVELWPATLPLCAWLGQCDLRSLTCLDLGCGLGLSALVAAAQGARVMGMDLEPDALLHAARNARRNLPSGRDILWACMDWNHPALAARRFERIWGGDIFYEQRFFTPLEKLLRSALAPHGRVWISDPDRSVSRQVWTRFADQGWDVRPVQQNGQSKLWELTRSADN